jgi:hypothetical protein
MKNLFRSTLMLLSLISSMAITAQVPKLSSYPSASAAIFLDFDGQTVTNTSWNYNGPIYCGASGLNNTQITEIFNRVAEDYRPFNINITTDSTKYWAAPANKRMRVIITVTSAWYGNGAGGVTFINSFSWGDNTPCFVFSALLGYNTKYISEASSHEAGHSLGLYHQATYDANCVKTSDYNYGTGSGETSWAPIMGVGYYKNSTTWYNGPNPYGCNNFQADLDIINANGFGFRPDDFGETFAAATSKSFSNNQFSEAGMISTPTDRDMFKFTLASTQRFQLSATPTNVGTQDAGSNLDISVELFNGSQTSLGVYNPPAALNVTIDTTLNAGTYYMRIDGVGNAYTSEYGSLGSYSLLAQESPPATLPLRRLELHGSSNGDKHQFDWIIDADEQVTEQILEISTDGRNFSTVTQSPVNARSFVYKPNVTTAVQYRLNVTFDNGKQYYSNIVTLRTTGISLRPQLVSNFINGNSIVINSPGNYSYAIYDFTGKTIAKGQLTNGSNNINASGISAGIYMIRFVTGSEQWTDKLIRQ